MFWFIIVIIGSLILQIQLLPLVGIKLDLLVLVTIYWGLLHGWQVGLGVGLLAGLLQDTFSGGLLGLAPVGLISCGLLAGYCRRMLLLRYWIIRVGLVFLLTVLNLVVYLSLTTLFSQAHYLAIFRSAWFPLALGNTILAAVIFWVQDRYS